MGRWGQDVRPHQPVPANAAGEKERGCIRKQEASQTPTTLTRGRKASSLKYESAWKKEATESDQDTSLCEMACMEAGSVRAPADCMHACRFRF